MFFFFFFFFLAFNKNNLPLSQSSYQGQALFNGAINEKKVLFLCLSFMLHCHILNFLILLFSPPHHRKKEIERLSRLDHLEMAEASSPRGRRNKESVLQMMEAAAVDNDLEGGGDLFTADTNHRRRSVLSDSTAPRFGFGTNIQQRKQSADKLANLDNRDFLILILARVEALDCSLNDLREDVMCLREEKQEYPDPFSDVARTSFFQ